MTRATATIPRPVRLHALFAAAALLALAACGGSGGGAAGVGAGTGCIPGDAETAADCGTVLVAVTDAEGDFVSYAVDVLSITLERADGSSVETLPATTRIDFAELTELTEILSAATVRPGDFVGGTIRLNYADAEVFVEAGGDIAAAELVDANGDPLGIEALEIRVADRDHLVVTRGRIATFTLDFDLAASHEVDTATSPPRVVTMPYVTAAVAPVETKELRLRGTLVDVDTAAGTYDIRIRPWHRASGDHGVVTVMTDAATTFEIGEESLTGAAGLELLATLDPGTLTIAFGTLTLADKQFVAEAVYARGSVPGAEVDAVHGNVVARDGNRLTVRGGLTVPRNDRAHLKRTVVVEVGAGTTVLKARDPATALDIDAISVGQRIVAFGTLVEPTAADAPWTLDATNGRVRLLVTRLYGSVNAVSSGRLELALRAIDRLGVAMFDFAGTGAAPATDADPAHYEITTGNLSLAALTVDRPAKVFGFVTPFGTAPPDFDGRTVIDDRNLRAALGIGYGVEGTADGVASIGATGLVPNLATPDLGSRHHLRIGARVIDLLDLPSAPTIAPYGGRALFGLHEPGHVELFAEFADFADELSLRLAAGDRLRAIAAYGRYDAAPGTLEARHVVVHTLPVE